MALARRGKRQWEVLNLLPPNDRTDIRTLGLNRRRIRDNRNRFIDGANCQGEVERRHGVNLHLNAGLLVHLEAWCRHGDVVDANLDFWHSIAASGPGCRSVFRRSIDFLRYHLCVGDGSTHRIFHRSRNRSAIRLRVGKARRGKKNGRTHKTLNE